MSVIRVIRVYKVFSIIIIVWVGTLWSQSGKQEAGAFAEYASLESHVCSKCKIFNKNVTVTNDYLLD